MEMLLLFFYEFLTEHRVTHSSQQVQIVFFCVVGSVPGGAHMHVKQKTPPSTKFFRAHNLHKLPLSPLFSTSVVAAL